MPTLGYCIVCNGRIFDVGISMGSQYYCDGCGLAYHRLTEKLKLTEKGLIEKRKYER